MSNLKILNHIRLKAFYNNRKTIPLTQYEHDESGILCNLIDSQNKTINLSDCTAANFYGNKPDGTIVGIKCIIENNSVIVPIKLQMTTAAGQLNGVLELSFGKGNIRFYGLNFIVSESANMDKIESTDEFTILETTIEEAKELLKFAEEKLDKPLEEGKSGQFLALKDDGETEWKTVVGGSGDIDLEGYATEEYVTEQVDKVSKALDDKPDIDKVYLKEQSDSRFLLVDEEQNITTKNLSNGSVTKEKLEETLKSSIDNIIESVFPQSKNLLKLPNYSISAENNKGISVSINNGLFTINGTAAEDIRLIIPVPSFTISSNTYCYSVRNLKSENTSGVNVYIKEGNGVGDIILGYRTSSASCSIRQLVVDENGNIITNVYDFYAVPASSVPRNQIFGEVEQTPKTT